MIATASSIPSRGRQAAWVALAAGVGALAAVEPMAAVAIVSVVLVCAMPITWSFVTLFILATLQSVSIPLGEAALPLAAPVALVLAVRVGLSDRRRLEGVELAVLGFLLIAMVTTVLHAQDPATGLRSVGLVAAGVAAFLSLSLSATAPPVTLLRAFLAVATLHAIAGLTAVAAHLVFGTSWGVTILQQPAGFPAARGFAFEHNFFGSSCAVAALLFLGLWRTGSTLPALHARWGFWISGLGLVASLTRGAWIGFVVGAVVLLALTRDSGVRRLHTLLAEGLAILLVLMGLAFVAGKQAEAVRGIDAVVASVGEQGARVLEFDRGTGYLRAAEWRVALEESEGARIFGLGVNSYGTRHVETTLRGPVPAFLGNWVIRTLHDTGVVGLALLAGAVLATVWPGRRVRVADPIVRVCCAAGLGMLVAYLAADALLLVWPWVFLGITRAIRRAEAA